MSINYERLYSWIPSSEKEYPHRSAQEAIDEIADMILRHEKSEDVLDMYRYYIKNIEAPEDFIKKITKLVHQVDPPLVKNNPLLDDVMHIALMTHLLYEDNVVDKMVNAPYLPVVRYTIPYGINAGLISKHINWIVEHLTDIEKEEWSKKFNFEYLDNIKNTQHFNWLSKIQIPHIQQQWHQFELRPTIISKDYKKKIHRNILALYQLNAGEARTFIQQNIEKMSRGVLQNAYDSKYLISGDEALIELCLASINMQELPTERRHSKYKLFDAQDTSRLCDPSLLFSNLLAAEEHIFNTYKDTIITTLTPMCEDILYIEDYFPISPERVIICMADDSMLMSYLGLIYEKLFTIMEDFTEEERKWLQMQFKWDDDFFNQKPETLFEEISTKLWNTCQADKPITLLHDTIARCKIQAQFDIYDDMLDIYKNIRYEQNLTELDVCSGDLDVERT